MTEHDDKTAEGEVAAAEISEGELDDVAGGKSGAGLPSKPETHETPNVFPWTAPGSPSKGEAT